MKIFLRSCLLLCLLASLSLSSCLKEDNYVTDPEKEIFNFIVTDPQREHINSSRGQQYEVNDPVPGLEFAGETYTIDRFEIRGDNTLNFTRKGFGVNMDRKITLFNPEEQMERKYEEFKLLAMVYDYTYIENSTGIGLFKEVGLWPVLSFFTEVRLNDITQGLYLFIEDPFEYFIEQKNASFVARRGYDHVVKAWSVSAESQQKLPEYLNCFERIYSFLPQYSGRQLYDTLSANIDMEQYFSKVSIDMLLKNGDYTDEIIFYTKIRDGKEVFGVFPWDLDDLFESQPHEIGRSWAVGKVLGQRVYDSTSDVIADVGSKLLFSIEDDLDYIIARDSVLYQEYLKVLRKVVEKIDLPAIDRIFDYTYQHVGSFYTNASIVAQSKYDVDETSYTLFTANLAAKRQMLKERRNWIMSELEIQQTR